MMMMMMVTQVELLIAFLASLVGAVILLSLGILSKSKRYYYHSLFVKYITGLTIILNSRYFINGIPQSIAFFVGVYDIFHNMAAATSKNNNPNATGAVALVPCLPDDPACSILEGSYYDLHPNWGVAFHHRFQFAPSWRTQVLLTHIACNTIAFCLMTWQLYSPGTMMQNNNNNNVGDAAASKKNQQHRILGKVSNLSLVLGVVSAILLSMEHGSVDDYGGKWSKYGFTFMGICVFFPAFMGMRAIMIVERNVASHGRWMFRCAGSMWGSFWIFRVMELVLGPLLVTNFRVLSLQLCIWCSAPIGLIIAEAILRSRGDRLLYYTKGTKQPEASKARKQA